MSSAVHAGLQLNAGRPPRWWDYPHLEITLDVPKRDYKCLSNTRDPLYSNADFLKALFLVINNSLDSKLRETRRQLNNKGSGKIDN